MSPHKEDVIVGAIMSAIVALIFVGVLFLEKLGKEVHQIVVE